MARNFRYEEIADEMRRQIQQGGYGTQRLPSERTLMGSFGVQRDTIRRALALLETEGLIVTEQKRGSFIASGMASAARERRSPPPGAAPTGATGTILVVTAQNRGSTARESILRGLSHALEPFGTPIQYFDSQPKPGFVEHNPPTLEYLVANNVVGLILWPQSPTDLEALRRLRMAVPMVLIDRHLPGFEADCISFDDVAGGRMATEHLLKQGHRRIGFFCDEAFAETVQLRWRGYTRALENAGIEPDPACVALFQGMRNPPLSDQLRLLLGAGGDPLTAVVCSNDTMALTLLRFLRSEGHRVPEDIAVTGYGNLLPDYLDALELTTVAQPFEELGRIAGEMLIDPQAWRNDADTSGYRQVKLPVRLIPRNSTGATARK